jgi:spermidine/putrescine transport system substrate-binding protein
MTMAWWEKLALCGLLAGWLGNAVAGELHLHTWEAYVSPELVAKFEQETGITVVLHTVTTYYELHNQLASGKSGFDITMPADFQVRELAARGLIEKINADRLPGFWNVEDNWRSRAFDPSNEYTIPHVWGTTGIVVDGDTYRGAEDTLALLFAPPPEIEGRIVLLDTGGDMVQLALMYLKEPRCSGDPGRMAKVEQVLAPMLRRYPLATIATVIDYLTMPGVALGVAWNGDAMRARAKRPSLRYVYPREGSLVFTDLFAVPRNPPNRANAVKWLTFMLKPENAAMQSTFTGYANMIRGSDRMMPDAMLSAPEMISPLTSKLGFFLGCDGAIQRRHEEVWADLKAKVKGR